MEQIWLTMYERAKMALKPREISPTIQVGSVAAAVESVSEERSCYIYYGTWSEDQPFKAGLDLKRNRIL